MQELTELHILFLQYRARDPASAGDHYMLVSFDDPPTSIKVGIRKNTSCNIVNILCLKFMFNIKKKVDYNDLLQFYIKL